MRHMAYVSVNITIYMYIYKFYIALRFLNSLRTQTSQWIINHGLP